MPSYQSVASAPHRTAESYAMRNNVSSLHAEQRVIDHYHPHNGVRHKTPPREQIYLVQSKENEGGIAHQTALHSGPDMNHSHPHRRDMRSASPSRELLMPMQNGGHYPSNLFTSGHSRVPPFQPGLAPQNSMTSDAVQHGGYEMWGPSPSYDSRLPPANHPPFYNANLPQSHGHPPYYDANMQHAHSLAHSNQRLNQYFASNQSVTNHVEPHANGSPVPPRSHYVMGAVPSRSQQSVSGPVQSSYPGHQRHPPVQNGLPPTQHAKYYSIE